MPRRLSPLPAQVNPFHETEALCWSCSRATGCDCPFFFLRDAQTGLEAVQAKALTLEINGVTYYKVIACPSYRKGSLRPIDARALLALAIKVGT